MGNVLKHSDITYKILSASFEVHKHLGPGYAEIVYQKALALEFDRLGLKYETEKEYEIYYKDYKYPIGKRRADFIVEGKVVVELKARSTIEDAHAAQLLQYLKVFNLEVGLLLNFGIKSLYYKRYALTPTIP